MKQFFEMKVVFYSLMIMAVFCSTDVYAKEYHVSVNGSNTNSGSLAKPFKTITAAVSYAYPGDTITVHLGTYREWINPLRGGENDSKRILYRAAPGEKVELKGSEVISGWKKVKEGVWTVSIPDTFFGNYNPYRDSVYGDWFNRQGRVHHTGEVFLNGKSLFEKETLEKVLKPVVNKNIADTAGSKYTWYCEYNNGITIIWANFHNFNPNKELVELSTRRTVFYPDKPGINYLTISGFEVSQAATQWGAPTAEQVGMISTNWNKGWIIENNIIHDSKCSGITLGKERGTGHNVWSADAENVNRDGNIHYIEVLFRVLRNGWNKDNIGSHIVRNNTIYNCEQTGMCGSMGAAFSIIENNHIYNIWTKRQFSGAEIGGIKFHAAVDTYIGNNRIHDCGRGIWLDWMTQGTRVSGNLMYRNDLEDIFLEVNHGPFVVDNNILLSPHAISNMSEGGAYLHNLIAGIVQMWPEPNRFTPYFLPHSTDIAALTAVLSGDDRFYNNVFVGNSESVRNEEKTKPGLKSYNNAKLPVFIEDNLYLSGAIPSDKDINPTIDTLFDVALKIVEKGESVFLQFNVAPSYYGHLVRILNSENLARARIPKARFENPDGTPLIIDRDYLGNMRTEKNNLPGPFVDLTGDKFMVKVW
jgi:hypothetical protein